MQSVAIQEAKRLESSIKLKLVHSHTDDGVMVDPGPKLYTPATGDLEDDDDEDLEEMIAAAHHRFEDDMDTDSLRSNSPPLLGEADFYMIPQPSMMTVSGYILSRFTPDSSLMIRLEP